MGVTIQQALDRFRGRDTFRRKLLYWVYGPSYRSLRRAAVCPVFDDRWELYRFILGRSALDVPIDYLEFGVFEGESIRWWVDHLPHPEATFTGFDSFEGLPEDWGNTRKGTFATDGRIPEVTDPRCRFVKGLFQDTVPRWLDGRDFSRPVIAHLDADLYSSTLVVLTQLLPRLKPGDVLIFDDFGDYIHEYRAFLDATAAFYRDHRLVGRTRSWGQVAFESV